MTTRGPATPGRRAAARQPAARSAASGRRAAAAAGRRDVRSPAVGRARPNRAATPRPAVRRAASASPPVDLRKQPARRLTVTTRAALLALTLCLVALTMAYPLRAYVTQRGIISDLRDQQSQDQQAIGALQGTVARYQDPASVEDEARQRLQLQLPGEKVFYLPPAPAAATGDGSKLHTPALPDRKDQPWFSQLWNSAVETSK